MNSRNFAKQKKLILIILLHILSIKIGAQEKHDYIWILGSLPNDIGSNSGGTMLDFNFDPPKATYFSLPAPTLGPYKSISDSNGSLLFYTNACDMFNRNHEQLQNGEKVNFGKIYDRYCTQLDDGYPSAQGWLTIPAPFDKEKYIAVYLSIDEENFYSKHILYSIIDNNEAANKVTVVQKNEVVMQDTALQDLLSAVRHANGRDWWIVVPRAIEPYGIFTILLSPEGFGQPAFYPVLPHLYIEINGQACFSPDGKKYCINHGAFIYIFDFDRCYGTFSNMQSWQLPIDNSVNFTAGGIAVSPNSEYVYVSTGSKVHQYNLKVSNIESTRIILTETLDSQITYGNLTLAPDKKIYGMPFGTSDRLHVIHQPNEKGGACQLEPYAFKLPTKTWIFLPYFPSYRLYDEVGSPCDTICKNDPGRGSPYTAAGIEVFPNPTRDNLKFKLPLCPCGNWEIFNIAGVLMHTFPANSQNGAYYELNVSHWPSGVYVLRGNTKDNEAYVRRFVVVK